MEAAEAKFTQIVGSSDPDEDVEWIFKLHKQLAKIYYSEGKLDRVLRQVGRLTGMLAKVNGNYAEESISKILHRYSLASFTFVTEMYDEILANLDESGPARGPSQRLWLRINMSRLRQLLADGPIEKCPQLLHDVNEKLAGMSELTQNLYALDVIAAEIEYCFKTAESVDSAEGAALGNTTGTALGTATGTTPGNTFGTTNTSIGGTSGTSVLSNLSRLYRKSMEFKLAITHPRVMGVIGECGATIHFFRGNYDAARVEFYECFKNYDEAGSTEKKKVLKYLLLCLLLSENQVNPFESQETQLYAYLDEYRLLIRLLTCCERLDLPGYLAVLTQMEAEKDPLVRDAIFRTAATAILHSLKRKLLLNFFKAYRTVSFDFLVKRLQLAGSEELERLLLQMTNSGAAANLRVDFDQQFVEIGPLQEKWCTSLDHSTAYKNLAANAAIGFSGPFAPPESASLPMDVDSPADRPEQVFLQTGQLSPFDALLLPQPDFSEKSVAEWLSCVTLLLDISAAPEESAEEPETSTADNDQLAEENTSKGILQLALPTDSHTHEPPEHVGSKTDALLAWSQKLAEQFR